MSYDAPPPLGSEPPPDPYRPPPPGTPPPGYGGYPPPYPLGYPYPVQQTSGKATTVLVLGILSLLVCQVLGIIAICLAPGAKREIAQSQGRLGGEGYIKAGVICAWISIALTIALIAGLILLIAAGTFAANR
jgi:hypothetical protein